MRSSIKGSYFQLRDSKGKPVNKWRIQLYIGRDPVTLKYKRHTEIVKGNETEAKRRLKELSDTQDKGVPIPQGKLTVAEHLNNWLDGYVKTNCSLRTYDGYKSIIDHHLIPVLGNIQLKNLNPQTIQTYYGKEVENLSARTVHHCHRVLSKALKYAVEQELLGRNPCIGTHPPKPINKTMRTLTQSEAELLLDMARGNKYYPVIYCALHTGMRQAELLGLRWRDINLDDDPVFANSDGTPFSSSGLSHDFERLVKRIGLAGLRFHDLRHSFASFMLKQVVNHKIVSEALGHASVAFTLQVYSKSLPTIQENAMMLLNEILPEGVVDSENREKITLN